MNSTLKGVLTILVVGGVVYASYRFLFKDKKKIYADLIIKKGKYTSSIDNLLSFGEDYLKEWRLAAKKGEETFTLKGVTYLTQGGKLKK